VMVVLMPLLLLGLESVCAPTIRAGTGAVM